MAEFAVFQRTSEPQFTDALWNKQRCWLWPWFQDQILISVLFSRLWSCLISLIHYKLITVWVNFFTPVKFSKKNFFSAKNFNQKFYAYCTFISTWNHPVLFNYLWLWQSYARSTVTIQRFYISIETNKQTNARTHTHTHTRPFFRDNPGEPVPER